MKKIIISMENKAIRKYGFESKKTIAIFRTTEIMRKVIGAEYEEF